MFSYTYSYLKGTSFYISFISSSTFRKQSLIKRQLKLINLRNSQICFTIVGVYYNLTTLILVRLILTLCFPIIYVRNSTSSVYYLYFLGFSYRSAFLRYSSTSITQEIYSSSVFKYTRILSKYTTTIQSKCALSTLLTSS